MNTFYEIFKKYDTDKTGNFSKYYDKYFTPIRNEVKLLFEIGVNRGGSVRAWKEFFPNAHIVGVDINPDCYFEEDRISIEICDANNIIVPEKLFKKYGYPDIMIDDGSHFTSDVISSFCLYSSFVKKCYVIEDVGVQNPLYEHGFYINTNENFFNIMKEECENTLTDNEGFEWKAIHLHYSICFFCVELL